MTTLAAPDQLLIAMGINRLFPSLREDVAQMENSDGSKKNLPETYMFMLKHIIIGEAK